MHPVYTLSRTPGATEMTEWEAICHSRKPFVVIDHNDLRFTTRWGCAERKRPFRVTIYSTGRFGLHSTIMSHHLTLAAAERAAERLAKEPS